MWRHQPVARLLKSINADTPEEGTMTTDSYHDTSLDMTRGAISPGQHAMLDYGVAAMFFAMGFSMLRHHKPAAALAIGNGALITGMSLLTDYPGGMFRVLDFRSHRTGDMVQAAIAGALPITHLSRGPRVPEHLEFVTATALVRQLVDGTRQH